MKVLFGKYYFLRTKNDWIRIVEKYTNVFFVSSCVCCFRNRSVSTTKHYLHRPSPDCNTMESYDSSSSESRGGLNRYYRQAWENLHQSANGKFHQPVRRKETLDPRLESMRSGSELMVSDVATVYSSKTPEKKKHHHHHHHQSERDLRHHHQSSKRSRYWI